MGPWNLHLFSEESQVTILSACYSKIYSGLETTLLILIYEWLLYTCMFLLFHFLIPYKLDSESSALLKPITSFLIKFNAI